MWLCRLCAHPWPCGPARLTLTAEYAEDHVALFVYLCAQLHEAVADLHKLNPFAVPDPEVLFRRFIGWAPPGRLG